MASASGRRGEFCTATHPDHCVDRGPGRYLAAIYWVVGGADRRARPGAIGDRLGVEPASVTEMFVRLDDAGLVDYEKQRGVELTERGGTVARELAWRQCAVRAFFGARLDAELDAGTAYRIGYTLPEQGIERLSELVGHRAETACCGSGADGDCFFGVRSAFDAADP